MRRRTVRWMGWVVGLSVVLSLPGGLRAQQTVATPVLVPYTLPGVENGSLDLGDYDADGDLDLLLTGRLTDDAFLSRVYRLDDSLFTTGGVSANFKVFRNVGAILNDVWQSTARWGDYDGDGDLDIALMGVTRRRLSGGDEDLVVTEIYENQNGIFAQDLTIQLTGVYSGDLEWGDFDGDGDADLAVAGATLLEPPYDPITRIYRNDGGRLVDTGAQLTGIMLGRLAWSDYDSDGDLDLTVMGQSDSGIVTRVYRNDDGTFTDSGLALPGLILGGLDWGDYDGDGDPDLVLVGGQLDPFMLRGVLRIYRNEGGTLTPIETSLSGLTTGNVYWGDYDVDGDLDLFVSGIDRVLGDQRSWIYRNTDGQFYQEQQFAGLRFSDVAVGDYNADGDVDFVFSGISPTGEKVTFFFMNRIFPELLPPDLFPSR